MIEFGYHFDWLWLILSGLAACAVLAWSYRSARTARWRKRLLLILLRMITIATVALCLLDPQRTRKITHPQPAQLAVLLDTSRSMGLQDAPGSRLDFGRDWLNKNLPLLPTNVVVSRYSFGSELTPAESFDSASPTGRVTGIGLALEDFLGSPRSANVAGILLCSDGASTLGPDPEGAARLCRRRDIPVFTLLCGTTNEMRDIVVENIHVKRAVTDSSPTRLLVDVRSPGFSNQVVELQIWSKNQLLASKPIRLRGKSEQVPIEFTPSQHGFQVCQARIQPQPGEWLASNNSRSFGLEVASPMIRVIYMEGTPGEWHYLQEAAESDPNIKVEGLYPPRSYPHTLAELLHYDVIINSDIKKELFTPQQLGDMVRFVEEFGGGFAMIGGYSSFGSGGYERTPVDHIIPVAMEESRDYTKQPFTMRLPPGALDHPLMALGDTPEENERIWRQKMPRLLGHNRVDHAKPGAVVLGEDPDDKTLYGPSVVLAAQEVGKGRTLAFTSDTTRGWGMYFETIWGERLSPNLPLTEANCDSRYYRKFWINAIRWLAAGRMSGANSPVVLELAKTCCQTNEEMTATVQLRGLEGSDPSLTDVVLNVLDPSNEGTSLQTVKADYSPSARAFVATLRPLPAGIFTVNALAVAGGKLLGEDKQLMESEGADLEMAEVRANPALMANIARLSGGQELPCDNPGASRLAAALENKAPVAVEYRRTPLWNRWSLLSLVLGLLSLEWIVRRRSGLA